MPKKYRPKVKGYVLPYLYVEDRLLVLVAMERLKEPGEYYGTLLGGTSKNLRHIRESTTRELCEETRGYMQVEKSDLLEYMKFTDKDRCTIYLLPLSNSYRLIHEINGFRNGVLMPPECSESSFIIALGIEELRSWTGNKGICSEPYHYFKKPFINKYPLAGYRKFLQYFRRPAAESGSSSLSSIEIPSNCGSVKGKLKARTVSLSESIENELSTDSGDVSEDESDVLSVKFSADSSDTSSSSSPDLCCDKQVLEHSSEEEQSSSPVLEKNFTAADDSTVNSTENNALKSSALDNNALKSSALDNNALKSSALDNNALKSSALDNKDAASVPQIIYYNDSLSNNLGVGQEHFTGPRIWIGDRLSRVLNTLDERILKKEHKNYAQYFDPFKNDTTCCNRKATLKNNSEQQPFLVQAPGNKPKGIPILHKKLKTNAQIHSI